MARDRLAAMRARLSCLKLLIFFILIVNLVNRNPGAAGRWHVCCIVSPITASPLTPFLETLIRRRRLEKADDPTHMIALMKWPL